MDIDQEFEKLSEQSEVEIAALGEGMDEAIDEDEVTEVDGFPLVLIKDIIEEPKLCLLYTSPSPRDQRGSRMPSSA